jgi:hypothetical protein
VSTTLFPLRKISYEIISAFDYTQCVKLKTFQFFNQSYDILNTHTEIISAFDYTQNEIISAFDYTQCVKLKTLKYFEIYFNLFRAEGPGIAAACCDPLFSIIAICEWARVNDNGWIMDVSH